MLRGLSWAYPLASSSDLWGPSSLRLCPWGLLVGRLLLWVSCVCALVGFVVVWVPICSVPGFCAPLFTCMLVPGEMV